MRIKRRDRREDQQWNFYSLVIDNTGKSTSTGGSASLPTGRAWRNAPLALPGGFQPVPFDTLDFDTSGGWNIITGIYVCQKAGYFLCNWHQTVQTLTNDVTTGLFKNGVLARKGSEGELYGSSGADVIQCALDDQLTMEVYPGGANNIETGSGQSYMSVVQVA